MNGKEIERKYLITGSISPAVIESLVKRIHQTYLIVGDLEERVRMVESMDCSPPAFFYTRKEGRGMVRNEEEYEISEEVYSDYIKNKLPLIKDRSKILDINEHEAILDVYINLRYPLTIAEVEFNTEEEALAFQPPLWFGPEITDDTRYKNSNLWLSIQRI